jgi:hypothetical protein
LVRRNATGKVLLTLGNFFNFNQRRIRALPQSKKNTFSIKRDYYAKYFSIPTKLGHRKFKGILLDY